MTVETKIGKITASKDTLNELLIALCFASEYLKNGAPVTESRYNETYDAIYQALEKTGYYK